MLRGLSITITLSTGCGTSLWFVTPRPDVTHYEVTRMAQIDVTATPPGATVVVDGAEAGPAPRSVPVAYKEMRRQRRQATWPAIAGAAIDLAATIFLTVALLDDAGPEPALPVAAIGMGVVMLDLYLINGRSIVHEGVDIQPMPVEISVRAPGHADATRRVRVPDFTKLHFELAPGATASEAPTEAPPSPP